jgi:hypothetical protein
VVYLYLTESVILTDRLTKSNFVLILTLDAYKTEHDVRESFQFLVALFIWNCFHLPHHVTWHVYVFIIGMELIYMYIFYTLFSVICNLESYRYYTGYPKDLGPSRIIPFTSEHQFVQLLHEGRPVVVAFTIKYIPIL